MVRLPVTLCVLTLISLARAADFDEGLSDLCFTCVCSGDKTSIDCSRRGLTYLPDGFSIQVFIDFLNEMG